MALNTRPLWAPQPVHSWSLKSTGPSVCSRFVSLAGPSLASVPAPLEVRVGDSVQAQVPDFLLPGSLSCWSNREELTQRSSTPHSRARPGRLRSAQSWLVRFLVSSPAAGSVSDVRKPAEGWEGRLQPPPATDTG
ncbi:hypothetical protein NDU88_006073 [Pleurodeles waltl]|uniref:Uncharacterized protein n=1 Tax=Pleurodeles waltl TaxID=8319 RepID=A0AAV7UJW0_PLEWA|nr:hypothetical protein NDU88_006073 [Pleurodeles waltl]